MSTWQKVTVQFQLPQAVSSHYRKELFLTKLFIQIKQRRKSLHLLKKWISLIEKPGRDLKLLESTMEPSVQFDCTQ